jgi:hypothetical protein
MWNLAMSWGLGWVTGGAALIGCALTGVVRMCIARIEEAEMKTYMLRVNYQYDAVPDPEPDAADLASSREIRERLQKTEFAPEDAKSKKGTGP